MSWSNQLLRGFAIASARRVLTFAMVFYATSLTFVQATPPPAEVPPAVAAAQSKLERVQKHQAIAMKRVDDAERMVDEAHTHDEKMIAKKEADSAWEEYEKRSADVDAAQAELYRAQAASAVKDSRVHAANAKLMRAQQAQARANKKLTDAEADLEAKKADPHQKHEAEMKVEQARKSAEAKDEEVEKAEINLADAMAMTVTGNDFALRPKKQVLPPAPAAVAAAAGTPSAEANQVHVIIAAHTRQDTVTGGVNGIADGAAANRDKMKTLLENESKGKANTKILDGNSFTHQGIMDAIGGINPGPTDTIVLYIACHGATDTVSKQHFLQIFGGPDSTSGFVVRTRYLNALKAKMGNNGARQVVMITDSCSNALAAGLKVVAPAAAALSAGMPQSHALSKLLLHQSGVYDFGGSRPPSAVLPRGEVGAYYADGGLYTNAFYHASLYAPVDQGWNSLFTQSQTELDNQVLAHFSDGVVRIPGEPPQNGQHTTAFPVK